MKREQQWFTNRSYIPSDGKRDVDGKPTTGNDGIIAEYEPGIGKAKAMREIERMTKVTVDRAIAKIEWSIERIQNWDLISLWYDHVTFIYPSEY